MHRSLRLVHLPKGLPDWDEMSDEDKSSAINYIYRADNLMWDQRSVTRNFPCEYLDDPRLKALSPKQSCKHAWLVTGGYRNLVEHYKKTFYEIRRLANLAAHSTRAARIERIAAQRAADPDQP